MKEMRVKLLVCDACQACTEDDGYPCVCVGETDARHRQFKMRSAEFIEAAAIEHQVATLLDACEDIAEVETPAGMYELAGLRAAYEQAQW